MAEHNQRFDSFEQWCNKASSWLRRHERFHHEKFRAICFDAQGRLCEIGLDFMRARDEDAFPVRWIWPDQVPPLVLAAGKAMEFGCDHCADSMRALRSLDWEVRL